MPERFDDIRTGDLPQETTSMTSAFDSDKTDMDKQEALRFGEDTKHRGRLVCWMMGVVSGWLVLVSIIVLSSRCLQLSDAVLVTLLATTTANVLGLSKIILNGLFPKDVRRRRWHMRDYDARP